MSTNLVALIAVSVAIVTIVLIIRRSRSNTPIGQVLYNAEHAGEAARKSTTGKGSGS